MGLGTIVYKKSYIFVILFITQKNAERNTYSKEPTQVNSDFLEEEDTMKFKAASGSGIYTEERIIRSQTLGQYQI